LGRFRGAALDDGPPLLDGRVEARLLVGVQVREFCDGIRAHEAGVCGRSRGLLRICHCWQSGCEAIPRGKAKRTRCRRRALAGTQGRGERTRRPRAEVGLEERERGKGTMQGAAEEDGDALYTVVERRTSQTSERRAVGRRMPSTSLRISTFCNMGIRDLVVTLPVSGCIMKYQYHHGIGPTTLPPQPHSAVTIISNVSCLN
jgi:hypothetical protein